MKRTTVLPGQIVGDHQLKDPSRERVIRAPGEGIATAIKGRKKIGTRLFHDEFLVQFNDDFK